jgi:hypothetical protein
VKRPNDTRRSSAGIDFIKNWKNDDSNSHKKIGIDYCILSFSDCILPLNRSKFEFE